jgi:hypothetical protein
MVPRHTAIDADEPSVAATAFIVVFPESEAFSV